MKPANEEIKSIVKNTVLNNIMFDVNTSKLISIKTGGKALCYFVADKIDDLKKMVECCLKNQIKFMVIGDGTNILFSDIYVNLVLIKLGRGFNYLKFGRKNEITVGAAYRLLKFIIKAADKGYDFSRLSGIPGTMGGSVIGNSGDRDKGICDYIKKISYISDIERKAEERTIILKDSNFGYRYFHVPDLLVLTEVVLNSEKLDRDNILRKIRSKIKNKKLNQPVNTRSSGCFFKNPRNCSMSAGALIEKSSLKGFTYGGARVSEEHANFIENFNNASAEDIFILSKIVRDTVMDKFKVNLQYEIKMIGF